MSHHRALINSLVLVLTSTLATSFAHGQESKAPTPVSDRISEWRSFDTHLGCPSFESEFYDDLYRSILQANRLPSVESLEIAVTASLKDHRRLRIPSTGQKMEIIKLAKDLYRTVAIEGVTATVDDINNPHDVAGALANLELGDRTNPRHESLMNRIRAAFTALAVMTKDIRPAADCPTDIRTSEDLSTKIEGGLISEWKKTKHPVVYGALKSFATALQSCEAATKAPLTSKDPDVSGIKVTGLHPDGIGNKRVIEDLESFITTHPYLADYRRPDSRCFRVLENPMIYDYGGKPHVASDLSSVMNFFKDAGSGTQELGIDCSGYVFTALAASGLRVAKGKKLKPVAVYGIRARQWMKPAQGGLSCFETARFSQSTSLKPGDILASAGHVVIIESIGRDPLGISRAKTSADCAVGKMSTARFDFTILHSGSAKNGLGLARLSGRDYFSEGGSMAEGLLQFASAACLAKVERKTVIANSEKAGLVRHSPTMDCLDQPVQLVSEDCVSRCPLAATTATSTGKDWQSVWRKKMTTMRPLQAVTAQPMTQLSKLPHSTLRR